MHADALRRLAGLDACALSDALDRLALPGCVTGLIGSAPGIRFSGRVHTVKLEAGAGPARGAAAPHSNTPSAAGAGPGGSAPRHLGTTAIEACAAGEVIVLEQRTGVDAACWGGILSRGAKLRGVAGIIADGPVRDIDEACAQGLPVFSRGWTARTARGRIHEAATDVPVRIGDVTVNPGDYVVADSNGIVFVPPGVLAEVLRTAQAIVAREAAMAQRLAAGQPISAVMGADYEDMLRSRPPRG